MKTGSPGDWKLLYAAMMTQRARVVTLAVLSTFAAFAETAVVASLVPIFGLMASQDRALNLTVPVIDVQISLTLPQLLVASAAAVGLRAVLQGVNGFLASALESQYEAQVRVDVTGEFLRSSWHVQSTERLGHLQTLLTENVIKAAKAIHNVAKATVAGTSLAVLVGAAVVIDPIPAAALAVAGAALFLAVRPLTKAAWKYIQSRVQLTLDFAGDLNETVLLVKEIRAFDAGEAAHEELTKQVREIQYVRYRSLLLSSFIPVAYQNLAGVVVLAGLAAVWFFEYGEIASIGATALLLVRALTYTQALQSTYHFVVEGLVHFRVIETARDTMRSSQPTFGGAPLVGFEGLEFDVVSFRYPGADELTLQDLSFTVRPGQALGIAGPSGAGKSTVVQILLRLRSPTSGEYRVNAEPAGDVDPKAWSQCVAYVPQEPTLFSGTIRENIEFFRSHSETELRDAARRAGILEEIEGQLGGWDAPVGERGSGLSGGQRQRLAIARALVGNPKLIILDEPTSALDPRSEKVVRETLSNLKGTISLVIVAHRAETLDVCDHVVRLDRLTANPSRELAQVVSA